MTMTIEIAPIASTAKELDALAHTIARESQSDAAKEFCLLTITNHKADWTLYAIAERKHVSEEGLRMLRELFA